ncbi:hypothetical protein [Amycolatopsis solani]|uniref:hypothetical protein n=1 Tax=Amycolatopsis solani TaxID=3028615 RepID=UPI0025B00D9D|nr:hypothetical protein [Amycolatopsis sp. MEP2-6]
MTDDPRIGQYERERAEAVELAHRAMLTSYIGAPPPGLRGDADRMVAALLKAGWTPPGELTAEHAWVDGKAYRRRVIVVEDWTEVAGG